MDWETIKHTCQFSEMDLDSMQFQSKFNRFLFQGSQQSDSKVSMEE